MNKKQEARLRATIEMMVGGTPEWCEILKQELALEGIEFKEPPAEGYDKGRVMGKDFYCSESVVREAPEAVKEMLAVEVLGGMQRTIQRSDLLEANGLPLNPEKNGE